MSLTGISPFTKLVYPIPQRDGLGIHSTIIQGKTMSRKICTNKLIRSYLTELHREQIYLKINFKCIGLKKNIWIENIKNLDSVGF